MVSLHYFHHQVYQIYYFFLGKRYLNNKSIQPTQTTSLLSQHQSNSPGDGNDVESITDNNAVTVDDGEMQAFIKSEKTLHPIILLFSTMFGFIPYSRGSVVYKYALVIMVCKAK